MLKAGENVSHAAAYLIRMMWSQSLLPIEVPKPLQSVPHCLKHNHNSSVSSHHLTHNTYKRINFQVYDEITEKFLFRNTLCLESSFKKWLSVQIAALLTAAIPQSARRWLWPSLLRCWLFRAPTCVWWLILVSAGWWGFHRMCTAGSLARIVNVVAVHVLFYEIFFKENKWNWWLRILPFQ